MNKKDYLVYNYQSKFKACKYAHIEQDDRLTASIKYNDVIFTDDALQIDNLQIKYINIDTIHRRTPATKTINIKLINNDEYRHRLQIK